MRIKKIICMVMMISIMVSGNSIYGAETDTEVREEIEQDYINVSQISAGLSISSGCAYCSGASIISKNYPSKIRMVLTRSSDGITFHNVKEWTKDYTGTGTKMLSKTKTVSKGYYYRLMVEVKVYYGNNQVENIITYSSKVYY